MNRPDHPALRSHRRNRSVLPARAAQSRQSARRKRTGTPMSVSEFRCLAFSFCRSEGAKSSLGVLAAELGEMPIKKPLLDSQSHRRIVRLRLDFLDDSAQFESVAVRGWFQYVTLRHAKESLLQIGGNIFKKKIETPIRITPFDCPFFPRHAVFKHPK